MGEPFDRVYLTTLVRGYIRKAKIGKTGGCHLFRHTVATLMLENGADIRVIQEMLGHAKLTTTELYTRVSINLLKQVYSATHPAAHLHRPETPAVERNPKPRRNCSPLWPPKPARRAEEQGGSPSAPSLTLLRSRTPANRLVASRQVERPCARRLPLT